MNVMMRCLFAAAFNNVAAIQDNIGFQRIYLSNKLPYKTRPGFLVNMKIGNKSHPQALQIRIPFRNNDVVFRNPDGI